MQTNKTFFLFFPLFVVCRVVPASDHLGICSSDWQCNFTLQFLSKNSMIEKKRNSVRVFCHPTLDENYFTFHRTFFARRKLFFSLFFLVRKLISKKIFDTIFSNLAHCHFIIIAVKMGSSTPPPTAISP